MKISSLSVRASTCWLSIVLLTANLGASNFGGVLHGHGMVLLNGTAPPLNSSAIFPGDKVETSPDSAADISGSGWSVIVIPESELKMEDNAFTLEHGGISAATGTRMTIHAGGASITPSSTTWARFEVTQTNQGLSVIAHSGQLSVACGNDAMTLSEGEQLSRTGSDKCKKKKPGGAFPPSSGGILTNPYVLGGATAASATVLCLLLCSSSTAPASPSVP